MIYHNYNSILILNVFNLFSTFNSTEPMLLGSVTDATALGEEIMNLPSVSFTVQVALTVDSSGASTSLVLTITSSAPQGNAAFLQFLSFQIDAQVFIRITK